MQSQQLNRYQALIADIFFQGHRKDVTVIPFTRVELLANAEKLGIELPRNPGDIIYSFRYRNPLPAKVLKTQPKGMEWVIEGTGKAKYEFRLVKGGNDQLSTGQAKQDLACCAEKFPDLICRAISAQFMDGDRIAIFELCLDETGLVKTVEERHYQLVPADRIECGDLAEYRARAQRQPIRAPE